MMRNKQYAKPSHYSSIETLDRRSKEFAQTFVPDLIAKNTHPAVEVFANDAIFQVRSAVASAKVKNAAGCASAQVLLDNLLKTFMVANAGDSRAMAGINSAFDKAAHIVRNCRQLLNREAGENESNFFQLGARLTDRNLANLRTQAARIAA